MHYALVAVPVEDASSLTALQEELGLDGRTLESKPFDGDTLFQLVVPITIASVPILKTWIKARFEHRSNQTISVRGMKFTGYSVKELNELTDIMQAAADEITDHDSRS